MKIKIISIFLLAAALSFSCKKEEAFTGANAESLFLRQIITDKSPSAEYTYSSAKFINEEKGKFAYTVNHYNDNDQLVSAEYYVNFAVLSKDPQVSETAMSQKGWVALSKSNLSGIINYEYNEKGQLIKTVYTPQTGSPQSSEFTYDENERIGRQNLMWENSQLGYIEYTYDVDGNLTEENLYTMSASGTAELSITSVYEFDGKQNPFKLISRLMIPGINTNTNNIIKETQTIHLSASQGGDITEVTASTYNYNTNGYPIGKNGNVEYLYQ
jgi:hypothetical protein